jgi:hypothetical protein
MVPKKKKGFPKLITDNKIYYWRLNGIVEIRPDQNQTNKLEIDFGYFDYWEFANNPQVSPEDFEPKIITPGFIKKIIENAIQLGWNINDKNKVLKLSYRNTEFRILE